MSAKGPMITVKCDFCGSQISRTPGHIHKHNFCCRQCLADYSSKSKNPSGYAALKDYSNMSKHMTELNKQITPVWQITGKGKNYVKRPDGRQEHRIVAEQMLGRPLKSGEVVHHIDGDKHNNSPENLIVFASNREHVRYHAILRAARAAGGNG